MKRRWLLWLALLLLVGTSFFLPPVSWRVIGWTRGEAFYQGRPTSYWRKELLKTDWDGTICLPPDPKPQWAPEGIRFLWGDPFPSGFDLLAAKSADAIQVWRELAQDEHEQIRILAEDNLRRKAKADEGSQ